MALKIFKKNLTGKNIDNILYEGIRPIERIKNRRELW